MLACLPPGVQEVRQPCVLHGGAILEPQVVGGVPIERSTQALCLTVVQGGRVEPHVDEQGQTLPHHQAGPGR